VPDTVVATLEYGENYLATFALSYRAMRYHTHNDHMTMLHGTQARFDVGREGYTLWPQQGTVKIKPEIERDEPGTFVPATRAHIRNFLECVRTRNEPNCPVEEGVKTTIALSLATAALRSGKRAKWDAATRRVVV
jgi:predicted dehydrogenase